jgi:hypothetical protein
MRFIQLVTFIIGGALILTLFSENAFAQNSGGNVAPTGQEISFHIGPLLPDQLSETAEILSGVGFRYGTPLTAKALLEFGYTGSNSAGIKYNNVDASIRGDVPFQDMFAFGLIGIDATRIRGTNGGNATLYGGGHVGGGFLLHLADTLFARTEIRFNFHPGTILFFGFGFEYRFGAGGGGK